MTMELYRRRHETDKEYEARCKRQADSAAKIQMAIDQHGIATLIADLIADPIEFSIRFQRTLNGGIK